MSGTYLLLRTACWNLSAAWYVSFLFLFTSVRCISIQNISKRPCPMSVEWVHGPSRTWVGSITPQTCLRAVGDNCHGSILLKRRAGWPINFLSPLHSCTRQRQSSNGIDGAANGKVLPLPAPLLATAASLSARRSVNRSLKSLLDRQAAVLVHPHPLSEVCRASSARHPDLVLLDCFGRRLWATETAQDRPQSHHPAFQPRKACPELQIRPNRRLTARCEWVSRGQCNRADGAS